MVSCLQAIAKRHKLDNTGAIKAQAITDMVWSSFRQN